MVDVPLGSLLPILGLIAVLCLAMVWVMVRFSAAMVARRPDERWQGAVEPDHGWRERRLGLAYLLLWAGIVAAFLHLMRLTGKPLDGRNLGLLLLVAGGWLAFNGAWIALVRAGLRADERAAAEAAGEDPAGEDEEQEEP